MAQQYFLQCVRRRATEAPPRWVTGAEREALERVRSAYDGPVEVVSKHRAGSLVLRNEIEFLPQALADRWAYRLHLVEQGVKGEAARYIGFVNLRPPEAVAGAEDVPWMVDAMLAPPRRMAGLSYSLGCLDYYSAFYGSPAFQCLPYCIPHPSLGGFCAQAAVFIATTIMSRFGGRTVAPLDATLLVASARPSISGRHELTVRGLNVAEILSVLESDLAGLEPGAFGLWPSRAEPRSQGVSPLLHWLDAGVPLLAVVSSRFDEHEVVPTNEDGAGFHVIVIVGYCWRGDRLWFVYHNPSIRPYMESPADDIIDALAHPSRPDPGPVNIIVPAPRGLNLTIIESIYPFLDGDDPRNWLAALLPPEALAPCLAREWLSLCRPYPTTRVISRAREWLRQHVGKPAALGQYLWLFSRKGPHRGVTAVVVGARDRNSSPELVARVVADPHGGRALMELWPDSKNQARREVRVRGDRVVIGHPSGDWRRHV